MSKSQTGQNKEKQVPLLSLRDLRVGFGTSLEDAASSQVLCGIDLDIAAGQSVALIGDSGCGKSMTARAVCGLLPVGAHCSGDIIWRGQRLKDPEGSNWQGIRGSGIGLVLQEPTQCLNPVITVGRQIAQTIKLHNDISDAEAQQAAIDLLAEVQLPNPSIRADFYPHQLSGGMCQRVLIAAALACNPDLLIADEPTTSLDPTVQREILLLLNEIVTHRGMALLFISHDHDLVPVMARKVARMRGGRIISFEDTSVFSGTTDSLLMAEDGKKAAATDEPVLKGRNLNVSFGHKGKDDVFAVRSVDLELFRGQALGLAGESGCGKTTLARMLSGHLPPSEGTVTLLGQRSFYGLKGAPLRRARRSVQLMFQNAAGSLNPRQTTGTCLREAAGRQNFSVEEALTEVGLDVSLQVRYPHELSGGQRQRIALARALACNPDVLVADEPTTALDPENRTLVLDLLSDIMKNRRLALLVISHDLQVLHRVCTRVAIMVGGYVVEVYRPVGDTGFRHPYGQELWSAQPRFWSDESGKVFGRRSVRKSTKDSNVKGCPYAPECRLCKPLCNSSLPGLLLLSSGDSLRCPEVGL